jgi:hypothetical protein
MTAGPFDSITVVLDRSGSMQAVKEDHRRLQLVLNDQRSAGKALFTLVQFDNQYEVLYDAAPIETVKLRMPQNYQLRSSMALLDALAKAVAATAEKVSQLACRPESILVSVVTNGLENASIEFSGERGRKQIFAMIDQRKKRGGSHARICKARSNGSEVEF